MHLRTQLTLAAGLFLLAPVILFFAIDFLRDRVVKSSHLDKVHGHSSILYNSGLESARNDLRRPFINISGTLSLLGGDSRDKVIKARLQKQIDNLTAKPAAIEKGLSVAVYNQKDKTLLASAGPNAKDLHLATSNFQLSEATGFIQPDGQQLQFAIRMPAVVGDIFILYVASVPVDLIGLNLSSIITGAIFVNTNSETAIKPFHSDSVPASFVTEIESHIQNENWLASKLEIRGDQYAGFASRLHIEDIDGNIIGDVILVRDTTKEIIREEKQNRLVYGGFTVLIFASIILLLWFFNRSFRPLNQIIEALRALTRQDFEWELPRLNRRDELGLLSETLHDYRNSLIDRHRLEDMSKKMQFAAEIQRSILPNNMSVSKQIEVAADMIPAEEVGGDFYDYFQMPDGRTAIVVADVADKGPGSALFGALASAMIRATAGLFDSPSRIITTVNNQLSDRNEAKLFVTLFLGIIDAKTGTLTYCNAGHEPPYIMRSDTGKASGKVEILPHTKCIPLGLVSEMEFIDATYQLDAGDTLVLYTDGVTEATNATDTMFTRDRLNLMLGSMNENRPDLVMASVLESVENFAGDSGQVDDITLLVARMNQLDQPKH